MKVETINRKDFVKLMATNAGVSQAEAERMYEVYLKALREALATGKRVLVGDMLRLEAVKRKGGKRINPRTRETVETKDSARLRVQTTPSFVAELEKAVVGK